MEQKHTSFSTDEPEAKFDEIFGFSNSNCNESRLKSSHQNINPSYSQSLSNEALKKDNIEKKSPNEPKQADCFIKRPIIGRFSISDSEQKIEELRYSKNNGSKESDIFREISPPKNRFSRRQIFQIENYQKYMKELDHQAQNISKINQSYRQNNNNGNEKKFNLKTFDEKIEVQNSKDDIKKSRKRAPTIEKSEEKPAFFKPVGISFETKQKIPKVKIQEPQKLLKQNSNSLPLERNGKLKNGSVNLNNNKKNIICFHCGGPHYANNCTSQVHDNLQKKDIKCYNCKKQGHTAKFCTQQWCCTNCQSTEHFAKNCPFPSYNMTGQKICSNCLQQGHYARQCIQQIKCFQCQQYGHQRKDCPKNKKTLNEKNQQYISKTIVCYNCKKVGHFANQCDSPVTCHKCGLIGHYARDCPQIIGSLSFHNHANSSIFSNKYQNEHFFKKSFSQTLANTQKSKIQLKMFNSKKNFQQSRENGQKNKKISRIEQLE